MDAPLSLHEPPDPNSTRRGQPCLTGAIANIRTDIQKNIQSFSHYLILSASTTFVNRAKVTYASIVVDGKEREHGIRKERQHGIQHGIEQEKCLGFHGISFCVQRAVSR